LREGDIVMVVGNLDDRVRNNDDRYGTIISVFKDEVTVLLSNGDIWKGFIREVVYQNEQEQENE
jgi:hypothetical protein